MNIPFNHPVFFKEMKTNVISSLQSDWIGGLGPYSKKTQKWFEEFIEGVGKTFLTTSCTHALEASAMILNLKPGDEIIVPSYTFVSTALAYHMNGANIRFCDIRPDTLNLDENRLEEIITNKTRAIVPVHYAGVACEMDVILDLAETNNLVVIEDNAHGLFGKYKGKYLGTIGDMAVQSFHETKNISCGEGGAIIINNENFNRRVEIIIEKGTNRARFFKGEINKYSWIDKGSSYVMSDILASVLYGQLIHFKEIQTRRKLIWKKYNEALYSWSQSNGISLPYVPEYCDQSYHMYYLILPSSKYRNNFIEYLKKHSINSVFHYQPLHSSEMGKKISIEDQSDCPVATDLSNRLVRLPFFYDLKDSDQKKVISAILDFKI